MSILRLNSFYESSFTFGVAGGEAPHTPSVSAPLEVRRLGAASTSAARTCALQTPGPRPIGVFLQERDTRSEDLGGSAEHITSATRLSV